VRSHTKIVPFDGLISLLEPVRPGKTVVLCHGVFDLIHIGHIRYLEQARKLGDILVVTLTQDQYVNKGPHRPAFTESVRAEVLAALNCVDYVAINRWPTAVETIHLLKPDIYAKGAEFRDKPTEELLQEQQAVEAVGGEMCFIEDITSSSSTLINRHLDVFPEETKRYLQELGERYTPADIWGYIEQIRSLRVLVVGDAILDEYQFCTTIGKSSKEPTLVAKYLSKEMYNGGAMAISNHIAGFCGRVDLVTCLGGIDTHEAFIRRHLKHNITPHFIYKDEAPTVVKRRFIDNYFFSKYFEVYVIDERELSPQEVDQVLGRLEEGMKTADVVVVADFGHGLFPAPVIDYLCRHAGFLAVNTQINAGNRGFNLISKYPRADYVCLTEEEVRLDRRDQYGDIEELLTSLAGRMACSHITVTRGKFGVIAYSASEGIVSAPALATRVVDRIGAGDAVFALTALCAAKRIPLELIGFIGNVVGAQAVSYMGNQRSIEANPTQRHITSLLK
jgi:rfaE bifunctional protein nucleotidyltransferase chain/domain